MDSIIGWERLLTGALLAGIIGIFKWVWNINSKVNKIQGNVEDLAKKSHQTPCPILQAQCQQTAVLQEQSRVGQEAQAETWKVITETGKTVAKMDANIETLIELGKRA